MSRPIIVCATDLGGASSSAVRLACQLAAGLGADLSLVHVTDSGRDADAHVPDAVTPTAEAFRARLHARLADASTRLNDSRADCVQRGVACHTSILEGRPGHALAAHVKAQQVALVLLGRREGASTLMSGTADQLMRESDVPVMVVPEGAAIPSSLDEASWCVGIDFSLPSLRAARAVRRLVDRLHGREIMVHVTGALASDDEVRRDEAVLAVLSREELPKGGSERIVALGNDAAETLCDVARTQQADFIVVGTHGRHGVSRMLLGGTAERCLSASDRPVLVIKDLPASAPWRRPRPVNVPHAPHHILVADDFSEPAERALRLSCSLAHQLSVPVDVVHVYRGDEATVTSAEHDGGPRVDRALDADIRAKLTQRVADVFGIDAQTVLVHVMPGPVVPALLDMADYRGADLILVGTSGKSRMERWLLGSTAEKLVRTSSVPVLTVH